MLGTNTEGYPSRLGRVKSRGQGQVEAGRAEAGHAAFVCDLAGYQVHRRRAEEVSDEIAHRFRIYVHGRADLLDSTRAHDDDAIGKRHRLFLVVRDVDEGTP